MRFNTLALLAIASILGMVNGDSGEHGRCEKGADCSAGDCCSPWGFCGSGPDYCFGNGGNSSQAGLTPGESAPGGAPTADATSTSADPSETGADTTTTLDAADSQQTESQSVDQSVTDSADESSATPESTVQSSAQPTDDSQSSELNDSPTPSEQQSGGSSPVGGTEPTIQPSISDSNPVSSPVEATPTAANVVGSSSNEAGVIAYSTSLLLGLSILTANLFAN
ncbi:hypothetical protein K7432_008422 [Basidiobolus ranarum]|uniref:Chitin-binding type-1 domain-containing protein n=1 Tax=Basidiobolus ranarum TaxID=34480 RepID=A0ABR2WRZ2_9FUNG